MTVSMRPLNSRAMGRIGRVIRRLASVVVALVLLGVVYELVGAWQDARAYPPPGRLIDVGEAGAGYRLHLSCTGDRSAGRPTVILDTLAGGSSALWGWVQPEIAQAYRVCAYDRAGWGWSDTGPAPRDARQNSRELHALLDRAGEAGPFVLVGHSVGGLYARMYADLYPDQVAGIVLIDAAHPDQSTRLGSEAQTQEAEHRSALAGYSLMSHVGLFRLYFGLGGTLDFEDLPPEQREQVRAFWSLPRQFDNQGPESDTRPGTDAQVRATGGLGDLPTIVVTAGTGSSPEWLALQVDLVALSTNAIQRVVPEATHTSLVFKREHARETVRAIMDVAEAAHTGIRLADLLQ
jgi:pimeloyl-ACP methyl ester carboxylesterase